MSPPQWAYQVENFVTKPDDELICSICHSVFCNPVMSPCNHVFCKVCITKWLSNNRNCPICRKRFARYLIKQIVPIVKNLIMKLTLYCRNKEQGCESQFSLESCEAHMKECNFELIPCKNKPCKEKLFRKDLDEHETNGCPHRYIKCMVCGSKMSLVSNAEEHDCIVALQCRLRKKIAVIRKKNEKIKELRDEIKNLKDAPRRSANSLTTPSTASSASISPDEIRIQIGESSDSDESSDSFIAIISAHDSDQTAYENNPESILDRYVNGDLLNLSEYCNVGSQTLDLANDSPNRNDSSPEHEISGDQNSDAEEQSRRRRPPKRRLPPLFSTSEDDNDSEERQSWPSPKRSWLPMPLNDSNEASPNYSSSSFMEAGPSSSYTVQDPNEPPNDDSSTSTRPQFRSSSERNVRISRQKNSRARKSKQESKSSQGSAVFERTLALLEQYNLESDPEWLPEESVIHTGNTTTETDSSYDDIENGSSSSSLSDSDSDYSSRI